ncbi:lipoate--protein ligase family protein [Paenibacillus radicis (ex Xue et al. 2023)]|uniref:Lipoate--protein ligase family protein n=1 Tax=Paenibacillus radicis (ex Xue et al. 2023) TaxID=2972489 RepID=A0ABT1YD94_9BACL|nr:biotin/lipoate A/B protein ligase family protein [Paenibacillus radicis (ex Xue et al. 2023)]MCR8631173.1 lipoate--protein ligase family protein [Paenibacillus radicis (ex Xue et al. 2023)]
MKSQWRFISSGMNDPAYNMAVDEAILTAHSEGKVPPTVRFYGWNPATLSIGYFQKAVEEIDFDQIKQEGLGFVRRPTGGRAVLHDKELTYSIIVSESYPGIPSGVTQAYRVLSEGLLLGFRKLGLDARMVQLESEEDKSKYASMGSAACFDSPSWYELVVEGRKIAGSAQTRQKQVVLQHGSILLDMDVDQLFRVLKFSNERLQARLKQQFVHKAVAINDLCRHIGKQPVSLPEVEEAFRAGMEEGLDIELVESTLTEYEQTLVEQLISEKYANEEWNLRR